MFDNDDIALIESDIKSRLHGLPFKVENRSAEEFPCFLIIRTYEEGQDDEIGFVGFATGPGTSLESGKWYGASYTDYRMSDAKDTMIPALSWVVNKHLEHILGA